MNSPREKAIAGLVKGDTFQIKRTFAEAEITQFEALSRDHNPVHSDSAFAQAKGFAGPIAHGLLTATLITEIGGQLGWLASSMSFRFRRPVYPGDELTCVWSIVRIDKHGRATAEVTVHNGIGEIVLTAETEGLIPNEAERVMLASMIVSRPK